MSKRKNIKKNSRLREIEGIVIDTITNLVQDGTISVQKRIYYGSQISKDISCYDKKKQKYKNVELFSPVIYDQEHRLPPYSNKWEVYDDPDTKKRKVIAVNYPKKYLDFWYEERRRCLEGYEIGGVLLQGTHYWYLNYWRIKAKKRGAGYIAPHFLDLDKEFFDLVEQAREEERNIMMLKRRQIGFSEKVAALVAYEFTFFPASESLIVAGLDAYSMNTSAKCRTGLDALSPNKANAGRPFYKRRSAGKDKPEEFWSGYKVGMGVTKGYESKCFAITTKDNSQAASGKSPTLVIMEEAGINPLLMKVYGMIRPSIAERGKKEGRIVIFIGTGGEMSKGVGQMMTMFYNPERYDLLSVENVWDDNITPGTTCACFFPAWKYYVMDNDGNSYKEQGMILLKEERLKLGNNKKDLHEEKTQMPFTPTEAFSVSGLSPFNTEKLLRQRKKLLSENWDEKQQWGNIEFIYDSERKSDNEKGRRNVLFRDKGSHIVGVRWVPAMDGEVGDTDSDGDLKYPYLIIEHPDRPKDSNNFEYMFTDEIFDSLYGAGTDSYDKPKAPTSDSLGSCSIFKGYLNPDTTSNMFVARVTWRPSKVEKFYESTMKLSMYYNMCQNLIEWSNINIFDYYKNMGFENLLKERPTITYAATKYSKVDNKYGIDPNTKHVWEEHYATYIEENFFNMYDFESITRALAYRKTTSKDKHNDDVTISNMLALEHMLDNRHLGIEVNESNEMNDEFNFPISGFIQGKNGIESVGNYSFTYDDPDGFYDN